MEIIRKEIEKDVLKTFDFIFCKEDILEELNRLLLSGFVDYMDYKTNKKQFINIIVHCMVQSIMRYRDPEFTVSPMTKKYKKLIKSY